MKVPDYKYLIIGAGMTADAAVRGIREMDPDGSIGLVGRESDPPYNRPPLTKGLWKGKPLEKIWRQTEQLSVTLHLGQEILSLNAGKHSAQAVDGVTYTGEKILLATGGTPRRLPFGGDDILYYRTLEDYRHLRQISSEGSKDFVVIGGGFIGSEIAAALTMNGQRVTMVFLEDGISGLAFPRDLSDHVTAIYREKGVEVLPGDQVADFDTRGGHAILTTQNGRELVADGVIAGIGIRPNSDLAGEAGLEVGNGVQVDEYLVTSADGIFAAGDVAEFFNPALGKRIRVEHEDNANSMGRQAGRNMAGAKEPHHHLPYFYSDLFELGYEAIGELDARLETFADWEKPLKKGVIYYLAEGRVRGVLLWNVWDTIPKARALIAEPGPFTAADLKGRLP
jgi:NADPH-dependent 2,4-dienoyl-CoA reductase/sulfur reductase-like enzyme